MSPPNEIKGIKLHHSTTKNSIVQAVEGTAWQDWRPKIKDKKMPLPAVTDDLWEASHWGMVSDTHRSGADEMKGDTVATCPPALGHTPSPAAIILWTTAPFQCAPGAPGAEIVLTRQVFLSQGRACHRGAGRDKGRERACSDREPRPLLLHWGHHRRKTTIWISPVLLEDWPWGLDSG